MKKLMFATVLVASAAAFADPINAISFEGYAADDTFSNGGAEKEESPAGNGAATVGPYFYFQGESDGSSVKLFSDATGGDPDSAATPNVITRPLAFAEASPNAKYLNLSTEGGILWRSINPIISTTVDETTTWGLGAETNIVADGIYLDTLVQFTPTEDGGTPEITSDDKLVIWLNVDSSGATPVTNLMVRAGYVDDNGTDTSTVATNYVLSTASPVVAGQWYRLTIKAIADVTECRKRNSEYNRNLGITGFEIYLDGTLLQATSAPFAQGYIDRAIDATEYGWLDQTTDADFITYLQSGKVFPSLRGELITDTIQGIGFKGSGALDDIVWTEDDPFPAPDPTDFTLTWPAGLTAVSYTLGTGGQPVSVTGNSPLTIHNVEDGSVVTFVVQNADGAQKVITVTASSNIRGIDATGETFGWPEYLGAAVDGAYTIADANDLDMLRKGVAAGLETAGTNFAQTANIDMSTAGPFAGIGTYAANLTAGVAFCGTYDGQGFTISNVDFTQRNYGGVFNQVKGGTIKNLIVDTITCSTFDSSANSGEWGCSIIGNVGLGSTVQNLTAMGSFGSAGTPCTHNVAGIAIRVCGGASNVVNGVIMLETLVKDCTNNATLHGTYSKLGGISALTQDQNGVPNDYVKYEGCVNNGDIVATTFDGNPKNPGVDGMAGILAHVVDNTVLENCVNSGTITSTYADAKIGELVGWAYTKDSTATNIRSLTDNGGNAADASKKMINNISAHAVINGFKYATVADGVATTVAPPYTLAKDTTYLLEGNVAASATPVFTLVDEGDYIEFDTALGYTFAGTVAGEGVTNETTGTVIKYWIPGAAPAGYEVVIGNDTEHPVSVTLDDDDLAVMDSMGVDTNNVAAVNYALNMVITNGVKAWEIAILGLPPNETALDTFKIDSITIAADGKVTVTMDNGVAPKLGRGVNITLKVLGSNDLTTWDTTNPLTSVTNPIVSQGYPVVFPAITPAENETKKFYKVVVEFSAASEPPANQGQGN